MATENDSFFSEGSLDALVDSAAEDIAQAADESADGPPLPALDGDEAGDGAEPGQSPDGGEDDPLSKREKELQLREQRLAAEEAERYRQQKEAAWGQTWNRGMAWFAQAEQAVWRNAENQVDPEGYVREKLSGLNQQRSQWIAEYYQNLDNSRQEEIARSRIPEFAQYLIQKLALPKTDYNRLMRYQNDPDMMAQVAQDLRDIRQTQKSLAADKRRKQPSPGSGTAAGARKARNLDEYVDALLGG